MKNLSEKQRIIQEQANLIKGKENESITDATSAKDQAILAAAENLEQKERSYAEMDKSIDETEALSTQAANDLSEKEKRIQEQAKLIEENEKEGSSYALISKDKEILASEENLKWKKRAYSDLSKRLKDNEALSTRAMKKFSEKQKIIQEQAQLTKRKKRTAQNFWQHQKTFMRNYQLLL